MKNTCTVLSNYIFRILRTSNSFMSETKTRNENFHFVHLSKYNCTKGGSVSLVHVRKDGWSIFGLHNITIEQYYTIPYDITIK